MRDTAVRRLSGFHRALYRGTGGRIGRRLVSNDMLLLTTRGRRTGKRHEVPLLYLRDGHRLVVIASYGGRPRNPDWYDNLLADPSVNVQIDDRRFDARAVVATGPERDTWWGRFVEAYPGYADYQEKTDRTIPVAFLIPAEDWPT
ncbi:MAG: nitroreductase family deazaflavin-dependent oxidoreductase [Acidimicrobiia bacterium]